MGDAEMEADPGGGRADTPQRIGTEWQIERADVAANQLWLVSSRLHEKDRRRPRPPLSLGTVDRAPLK